jgi:histidinol dehydrogenase
VKLLCSKQKGFIRFLDKFHQRGTREFENVQTPVLRILRQVRDKGDRALLTFTERFDGWKPTLRTLRVSTRQMEAAVRALSRQDREALFFSAKRIERFHTLQKQKSWSLAEESGTILGQIIRPLDRVGIYVPGGKAAYPSSVLMNAIPARVAGVSEIIMACPAPKGEINPAVLASAHICGINSFFKIGGAQAIGAMAFGTKTIPRVDKIVGPGNVYVAAAKRLVFGEVAIDSIAGPSEIVIISDGSGDPSCLAADLISQAEHDEKAAAVLLCPDREFGDRVRKEVTKQLSILSRKGIAEKSLEDFGAILIVKDLSEAVEIVNDFAPEHLELAISQPFKILEEIRNAGAIFLGTLSPEAIGDYVAGPNHVLPTGGSARFSSPLGVYDFYKRSSLICLSPEGLEDLSKAAMRLAQMENLEGHWRSIVERKIGAKGAGREGGRF